MKPVTVITGGAGGVGLATAKVVGKSHHVIIADVNSDGLDNALSQLRDLNISCDARSCDATDLSAVEALLAHADSSGKLCSVIHTAGISPQMANAETIMRVNALGTFNITQSSCKIAREGFALVNVASMAAHIFPRPLLPRRAYPLAFKDQAKFVRRSLLMARLTPGKFIPSALAYGISKDFVVWLTCVKSQSFGAKGARIVSVSPGSIDTDMGRLEEQSGSAAMLKTAALKRFGRPDEIAEVLAFCASDKASYLTGTDILCDGAVVAGRRFKSHTKSLGLI